MNTEEMFQKPNEESFKEIIIQDNSESKNIIYIPNNNFSCKPIQGDQAIDPQTTSIIPICERDLKFTQVIHFAKFMKWMSLLEFLMVFTYIIPGTIFLLVLLFVPVLGFIAAKKLHKCLGITYLVYLMLSILLRVILMVATGNLIFIIVGTLIIVSNLIAIRYLVKLLKIIKSLSDLEKRELLILQNGIPMRKPENDIQIPQLNYYNNSEQIK
ncbi:hypothetical protein SteCoe_4140 [Stentor coeruleus]|uniref:Uncharacterized protein n=1 Tax=Stentor coeruleus TaxID=5963 RepID=A0A1R2CVD2_9CILI|nr:hypothetical protein SteCoe_4140 [Stentor coeruleus]